MIVGLFKFAATSLNERSFRCNAALKMRVRGGFCAASARSTKSISPVWARRCHPTILLR